MRAESLIGFVDYFADNTLHGWAMDRDRPGEPISVEIYRDDLRVAEVQADNFRHDLVDIDEKHPNKSFAHTFEPPIVLPQLPKINVRFAGTDRLLEPVGQALGLVNRRLPSMGEVIHWVSHNKLQPEVPLKLIRHVGGHQADARSFAIVGAGIVLDLVYYRLLRMPPCTLADLGCGCGRVALQVAPYLADAGSYHGFDTWGEGIEWAQRNVTSLYPNVEFHHLRESGKKKRKTGYDRDRAFPLELPDASCDLVIATSLFTHLTRTTALAYLREIHRVLKDDGAAYLTFFIHDDESRQAMEGIRLKEVEGGYRFDHREFSDFFFPYPTLEELLRESGLTAVIRENGFWRGDQHRERRQPTGYQDLLILRRTTT